MLIVVRDRRRRVGPAVGAGLSQVGSVHVAVIAGLIPAATAGMAALRAVC